MIPRAPPEAAGKAAPKLEEVRPQLVQELQNAAVDAYIKAQIDKAKVERPDITAIDPAVIKDTALLGK